MEDRLIRSRRAHVQSLPGPKRARAGVQGGGQVPGTRLAPTHTPASSLACPPSSSHRSLLMNTHAKPAHIEAWSNNKQRGHENTGNNMIEIKTLPNEQVGLNAPVPVGINPAVPPIQAQGRDSICKISALSTGYYYETNRTTIF